MDTEKDKEFIFSLALSKYIGLYQILNPNTKKVFGYNIYHVIILVSGLIVVGHSSFLPIALYYMTNDPTSMSFNIGCVENLVFSNYKILMILYYSKEIWKCIEVTGIKYLKYEKYNRNIFKNWRILSLRISLIYIIMSVIVVVIWIPTPLVLNSTMMTFKNIDGSYSNYRINVLNVYILLSDDVYNKYFTVFYCIEIIVLTVYVYFSMIFDILLLTICCALSSQLESVSNAISSLGYKGSIKNPSA